MSHPVGSCSSATKLGPRTLIVMISCCRSRRFWSLLPVMLYGTIQTTQVLSFSVYQNPPTWWTFSRGRRATLKRLNTSTPPIIPNRIWQPISPLSAASNNDPSSKATTAVATNEKNDDTEDETRTLIDLGRAEFQSLYEFPLDDWQLNAAGALLQGYNVIVSAPTGAGKTVVGEMALHYAFQKDCNGIFTTPLKALSNQKYTDLCAIFGRSSVGLSTGDISINKGARITVMTTEVYRNMAWRASSSASSGVGGKRGDELANNAVVVLDEFHFLGHPGRGSVWEESIITTESANTQIVGLSATLANAPMLTAWMQHVTGRRTILVEVPASLRPVPLRFLFAVKEGLFPLFRDPDAGPGAPKGLLGYRGDGVVQAPPGKRQMKKGFSPEDDADATLDADSDSVKIPRGLQVNPALRNAAERRLQKIDRVIERQKMRRQFGESRERDFGYDSYGGIDDAWSPRKRVQARKPTAREERKERERLLKKEMRRSVPALHAILNRLDQKDLLPAIFFIFSRNGCDEAARTVYRYMQGPKDPNLDEPVDVGLLEDTGSATQQPRKQRRKTRQRGSRKKQQLLEDVEGRAFRSDGNYLSDEAVSASLYEDWDYLLDDSSSLGAGNWEYYAQAGLLSYNEVREVASRIASFNEENEEIAFDDELVEQYLFGVGSHHAGMLPAHKSFVEVLFRKQLMKVVFATETLAAGINMPARTTVICAMAKRGDGTSMNLLETSTLLQMAGRAGRRGMDISGTCVIVATPFESHDDAWRILTDPVKPISSQFSPSYSLCVNLIDRGDGRLDVAKELVSKSFAAFEKREREREIGSVVALQGDDAREIIKLAAQEKFVSVVTETLRDLVQNRSAKFDMSKVEGMLDILNDRAKLKKSSKSFIGATKMLELEKATLGYLEEERVRLRETVFVEEDDVIGDTLGDDENEIAKQINIQKQRVATTEKEVGKHAFTTIATMVNAILLDETPAARLLRSTLDTAREYTQEMNPASLSAQELSAFTKSAVVVRRKTRRLAKANSDMDLGNILLSKVEEAEAATDDSWEDFLSITRTLHAYGCLSNGTNEPILNEASLEEEVFEITPAGINVGMLGFEHTLWCLVAVGGAWDVVGASSHLDEYRGAMRTFESDDLNAATEAPSYSKSQTEAVELVSLLKQMTSSELAGYVSCLLVENSRGLGGPSVVETFHLLSPLQQRAIQKSLLCLERLVEVQRVMSVDESIRNCNLDVSNCEVVTAWTAGCTWSEALVISGLPPGDLARTLSRVLDAVRQLCNLPFTPVRKQNFNNIRHSESHGLDPTVRRLCRDARLALNRYPVKDPFAFESQAESDERDGDEDDDAIDAAGNDEDSEMDATSTGFLPP